MKPRVYIASPLWLIPVALLLAGCCAGGLFLLGVW